MAFSSCGSRRGWTRDCTYTTETNGGRAHTHVLRDLDEGVGHLRGVGAAGLHGDRGGLGHEGGGALHGVEAGLAGGRCSNRVNSITCAGGSAIAGIDAAIGGVASLPE